MFCRSRAMLSAQESRDLTQPPGRQSLSSSVGGLTTARPLKIMGPIDMSATLNELGER
jgi:hypothetical protein